MAQQVKLLPPSLVVSVRSPVPTWWKERMNSSKVSSDLPYVTTMALHNPTSVHMHTKVSRYLKIFKRKKLLSVYPELTRVMFAPSFEAETVAHALSRQKQETGHTGR